MRSKQPIIEVKDLHVYFYTYAGIVKAINGVSFTVYKGEKFCMVGETGCGKTVISRALTNSIPKPGRIVKGEIIYYGWGKPINILEISEDKLREIRGKEIAYIVQDPTSALDPLYQIGYQISETMYDHGGVSSIKEGILRAVELLKNVLMPDPEKRVKNYPHELSGGQKQRAVISIGISNTPKLLIADEATSNLDVTVQAQLLELLKELVEKKGLTLYVITHDLGVVAEICERVAVLYAGNIVEIAPVEILFKEPAHPYTQALLKAVPNPLEEIKKLQSIPGTVPNLINPPSGCRFHPRCSFARPLCREREPLLVEVGHEHYVACWLHGGGRT